jgi:tetratricopeptide (TPR) repeat protein
LFRQAIALDPDYAAAHVLVAWTHWMDAQNSWSEDRQASIAKTAELAEKAHALDESAGDVYALKGAILLLHGQHDKAVASGEAAVALNPNQATTTALLGVFLSNAGRAEEAIHKFKRAMRLSPYYPSWFIENLGYAYLDAKQYDNAITAMDKYLERQPSREAAARAHIARALAFSSQGDDEKARAAIAQARASHPGIGRSYWRRGSLNINREATEQGLQRLGRLGLPE